MRLEGLRKQQVAIRAQLTALRKLEPMHARLQTLAHQLLPAATTKAEVRSSVPWSLCTDHLCRPTMQGRFCMLLVMLWQKQSATGDVCCHWRACLACVWSPS